MTNSQDGILSADLLEREKIGAREILTSGHKALNQLDSAELDNRDFLITAKQIREIEAIIKNGLPYRWVLPILKEFKILPVVLDCDTEDQ